VRISCIFSSLSSVSRLTKEPSSLRVIENKTSEITLEFNKIKEHASDLQTFLSLPHLISKANDEEKNVEKLGSDAL
jgi:hypothetical protein